MYVYDSLVETEEKPKAQRCFWPKHFLITISQFNQPGLASAAACTQSGDKILKKSIASSTSYARSSIFSESLRGGVMHLWPSGRSKKAVILRLMGSTLGLPTAKSRLEVMRV